MQDEFDLLSSYLDESALKKQTDVFLQLLDQIEKKGGNVADTLGLISKKFEIKSTGSKELLDDVKKLEITTANYQKVLAAVATEVDNLTDAQKKQLQTINESYKVQEQARAGAKETVNLIKTEIGQVEKLAAGREALAKTIAKNKAEIRSEALERDRLAKVLTTENGSREKAQAIIDLLINKGKKLNLETEQGRRVNEAYNATIAKQNEFILKNADVETKRIKNVGNYSKSAQIIVDAIDKQRLKLKELEDQQVKVQNFGSRTVITGFGVNQGKAGNDTPKQTEDFAKLQNQINATKATIEGFSRITAQPNFLNVAGKVGDATAEVKFFTKSLIDLERQGLGDSAAAKELRKNLAELTDQISDAKAEVKALSSDTRGFDLFAGSVTFAADAMQTFAGAAVLAGASEEDAAEATRTLVAIQSVANGVKGIANELTTRGTAANKVYAYSQKLYATATDESAGATVRLAAAGKLLMGIGLIAILGLVISNWGKIKEVLTGVTKAQAAYNETVADYQKGAQEAIQNTTKVATAFEMAKKGVISKDAALKTYNETLGDAFGKTNSLAEAEKLYTDKVGAYVEIMGLKAQANAIFAKSAEVAARGLTADYEDQLTSWDKIKSGALSVFGLGGAGGALDAVAQIKNARSVKEEAKKQSAELEAEAKKLATQAIELENKFKIKDPETKDGNAGKKGGNGNDDALKKKLDDTKRLAAAEKQIRLDNANEVIRVNQLIVDSDKSSLSDKIKSLDIIDKTQKKIAADNLADAVASDKQISNHKIVEVKKTAKEIEAAENAHRIALNVIDQKTDADKTASMEAEKERLLAIEDAYRQKMLKRAEEDHDNLLALDDINHNKRIMSLDTMYANHLLSKKEYDKKLAKEEIDYQKASLQREIAYQRQLILYSLLTGSVKAESLKKLAALEKDLNKLGLTDSENKNQDELDALDNIKEKSEAVFSFIGGMLEASATRRRNEIAEDTKKKEDAAAREIALITASELSEEKKAAKIQLVNARLQIQKDQNAAKDKRIQEENARFQKAFAIFNIILSTTQAVIKALGEGDPYTKSARAILAGVMGAAQLAVAVATPIPKFYKGKGEYDNYEGMAWVDDGGKPEAHIREDGSVEIGSNKPRLTWVGKNDIIHPDANQFLKSLEGSAMKDVALVASTNINEDNYSLLMTSILSDKLDKQSNYLKTIANKKELNISATKGGLEMVIRHGANSLYYVEDQINWTSQKIIN